jgi:hypothetical protein
VIPLASDGGGTCDLPVDGVHTRRYFGGAPTKLSSEGPNTTIILFSSSSTNKVLLVPSWSITALTRVLNDIS